MIFFFCTTLVCRILTKKLRISNIHTYTNGPPLSGNFPYLLLGKTRICCLLVDKGLEDNCFRIFTEAGSLGSDSANCLQQTHTYYTYFGLQIQSEEILSCLKAWRDLCNSWVESYDILACTMAFVYARRALKFNISIGYIYFSLRIYCT